MTETYAMTAVELTAAYRSRQLSPVEVLRETLARVRMIPQVNAFCALDESGALKAAALSEKLWRDGEPRGDLEGVPVSVKDLVPVKGMPTRLGSRSVPEDHLVDVDAAAIRSLRKHGAILFGKTTTSEFGNKIVTENPLTGVTRNAWNIELSSGGSSGGSAVAVALGMGPLSLATDGGGSIRIPSAWNGTVGFKPSFKRVPGDGHDFAQLSNLGPIARSVEDAALMFTVLTDHDGDDWQALRPSGRNYRDGLEDGIEGMRIAFSPDLGLVAVDPAIAACVGAAVRCLKELGARVEQVEIPPLRTYLEHKIHSIQWMVTLARTVRGLAPGDRKHLDPDTLELARLGEEVPLATYVDALAARSRLASEMHAFFRGFDLLVMPTFHVSPPAVPGLPQNLRMAPPLTSWCNQTMQPAASLPCGLTDRGLPVGLQVIGPRYADALVLRACRAYEQARGAFPMPALPLGVTQDAQRQQRWWGGRT